VTRPNARGEVDLFHANAAQWVDPDTVLVTIRHQDLVVLLDWTSGRIRWSWGAGELSGPHDATLLSNGNVLVFDNGLARSWSRVLEVSPSAGRIVWSYRAQEAGRFFSASRGSVQRLANGNTLIAESDKGRIFEVTASGRVVWDYLCPFRDAKGQRATIMRARLHDEAAIGPLLASGGGRRDVRSEPIH
jgi:outer membrane protein assembly factor BamB